jgi:cytochrome P450
VKRRYPNGVVGWVTTSLEDFRAVLVDPRFHAKRFLGEPQPGPVSVHVPDMPGFIPSMNGPEHLRIRRLAAGEFSVKRVEALRPTIEGIVDRHLDRIAALAPPVDLFANYHLPIPSEVIAGILGVPTAHTEEFQLAARLTIGGLPDELDDPQAPARAVADLHRIIDEVIELKRRAPAADLITKLVHESDPPLTDVEIKGLCTNLLLAGHETTASSSAMSVAIIAGDRGLRHTLLTHPERLGAYVEELIRFQALVRDASGMPRLATADVEVGGELIRAGEWVMANISTANSDPAVCPFAASQLELDRDPMPPWVTFGFGPHTCLGQHLARAEVQAIVARLFQRFPDLELVMTLDEAPWLEKGFGYRPAELLVHL